MLIFSLLRNKSTGLFRNGKNKIDNRGLLPDERREIIDKNVSN